VNWFFIIILGKIGHWLKNPRHARRDKTWYWLLFTFQVRPTKYLKTGYNIYKQISQMQCKSIYKTPARL
jgi:hypothetical protein